MQSNGLCIIAVFCNSFLSFWHAAAVFLVLESFLYIHWYFFLLFPCLCMIAFHCRFFPFGHAAVYFIHLLFLLLFVICISLWVFVIFSFISTYSVVFFIWLCSCLFYLSIGASFCFPQACVQLHFIAVFLPFEHAAVSFIHLLFLFLFVICLFVYDCIWFVYFLLSFGHAVVFLIPPWFVLFIQSKELCFIAFFVLGFSLSGMLLSFLFLHVTWFISCTQSHFINVAVFVICFVLFWASSCLPYLSTVHFIYQFQKVVVVVLLFHLLSCHLSLFIVLL